MRAEELFPPLLGIRDLVRG
ncbi:hypothetical protein LINPERHAP1_LOCUS29113 [Linum perenne]